ncbi:MAG: Holliday junction resolvase RuvX [Acidobacteria bacterium]|nr:Holliday junction resolvase RuvX [Acidobacteriota bacterium]
MSRPPCAVRHLVLQFVKMNRARILALDYGKKHVGLACSDELGIAVRPLDALSNVSRRRLVDRLREIASGLRAERIVVGLPFNMDGTPGEAVREAEEFVQTLRERLDLPIATVDERLSTVEAKEVCKSMSPRQRRKYRTVDSLAAALILKRYLDER